MIREVDNSDWIVVGAGAAGAVLADRLARFRSERGLVVERRDHVGGKAFDLLDDAGIRIHRHGPRTFDINRRDVVEYRSQFTVWRPCGHRGLGQADGQLISIPINLDTVRHLHELDLTDEGLEARFAAWTEPVEHVGRSEDVTARVPVRTGEDGRRFADRFQAMPRDGYTAMFARTFCRIEEEHPLPLQRRKPDLPERNWMAPPDMDP